MLLMLLPSLPLVLGTAALAGRLGRNSAGGGVIGTCVVALLVVLLEPSDLHLSWLLLGTTLALDEVSRVLLFCAALLWPAATLAAGGLFEGRDGRRFGMCWLFTLSGNLGMLLSQDLASFYLCFAVMTFSAYGLVVHKANHEAWYAGRIYLILAIGGESLLLAGIFLLAAEAGNPTVADIPQVFAALDRPALAGGLLLTGFAVKMGVIPLHVWLPLAHPAAPVPASAVLSGLLVKGGLIGWLRFLPSDTEPLQLAADILLLLGFAGAFLAALAGCLQQRPKTVLAYSTISQMGLLTVPVALLLGGRLDPVTAMPVIALFAGHHVLAKGALFLAVDHWPGARWRRLVTVLLALTIAGLPISGGLLAKAALKSTLIEPLPLLVTLSSITTSLLLLRALQRLRETASDQPPPDTLATWSWVILAIAAVSLPWALADGDVRSYAMAASGLIDASWPIALAGLIVLLGARHLRFTIAEGDILAPIERLVRRMLESVNRLRDQLGLERAQAALEQGHRRAADGKDRLLGLLERDLPEQLVTLLLIGLLLLLGILLIAGG
nr:complex I subunit 5 family protein [Methylonatrum kenyense]